MTHDDIHQPHPHQPLPGRPRLLPGHDRSRRRRLRRSRPAVAELVKIRSSQLNGCAFCLDMHSADARKLGLSEQKLYAVAVWREAPFFTDRERAALALAEAVTLLGDHGVPDPTYAEAARLFDADELPRLLAMCVTINAWNRIGVSTRLTPALR
ncbi:carboxymuconolactone decarboxylase family protein [Streptomyces sp. NPDC059373]